MIDAPSDEDDESPITPQERVLIGNILKLHDRTAADVMVPRVDIVAVRHRARRSPNWSSC